MREHGTLAAYVIDRCRCPACRAANTRYESRRARLIAYGQWQPYVDAEPVRQHVLRLSEAGLGWRRTARLAGVPNGSVSKLIYGDPPRGLAPSKRVRPRTAAALLAIQADLDVLGATVPVDGSGTRRRLQALMVVGWSQARLAGRLGSLPGNFGRTLHRDAPVQARTARAVRTLYEEMWDTPPPQEGHRAKISAARARNYAAARGWLPPAAWDDDLIDLPDTELETELARRVALMDIADLARCHTARYKLGDRSPLTVAAAKERDRRRSAVKRKAVTYPLVASRDGEEMEAAS